MHKKICLSKKLSYLTLFSLVGLSFFFFVSSTINNQKRALNSKAAPPKSVVMRPCGSDGAACCGDNKCNDGLTCDTIYDTCSPSSCGEDGDVCCGDIGSDNRCDSKEYSCTFSNYRDQICRLDPNRHEYNTDTFCGKADGFPDTELCAKSSGMTYPNPVKFKAPFVLFKNLPDDPNNPTTIGKSVMYMSELIHVAAPRYQLFIDCDNDKVFEKTKYAELDPASLTDYIDEEGNVIPRKVNTSVTIPFYCIYQPEKYGFNLMKSLRVNVLVKAIRGGDDPIDNYFSYLELNEEQIQYWTKQD